MSITIEDIARQLSLSVSTVSKALNDYNDVSETTKQRVREAAQVAGYAPSAAARSLRRQRTDKIGFSYGYLSAYIGEYASRLINGAVAAAEKFGYNITLYPLTGDRLEQIVTLIRTREVDGIMLMGGAGWRETAEWLRRQRVSFVVLVRRIEDPHISYVTPDDVDAGMKMTQHLLELGHTRIAFVARKEVETSTDRIEGYRLALEAAGISFDPKIVSHTEIAAGTAYRAVNQLLSLPDPPTAVIGLNDPVAIECQQAILDRGLRVPQDVAVAGSDNLRSSLTATPPLTTLHPPLAEIGRLATEALLAQIADPGREATRIKLPSKLIIRQSTAG